MSGEDARREVANAITRSNRSRLAFAKDAGLDPATLYDFLGGVRDGSSKTRGKIEQALGWPIGAIAAMFQGDTYEEAVLAQRTFVAETGLTTASAGGLTSGAGPLGPGGVRSPHPVGLGLDDEAADLPPEQVEAIRALIRSMKQGSP